MIIGITGKSGSGKSTISRHIAKKFNGYHIDIDSVMHDAINSEIDFAKRKFGNEIINANGTINRIKLGDLVFSNRSIYKEYSDAIYEIGLVKIKEIIDYSRSIPVILDHILLPHMKELWEMCDVTILVKANDYTRYSRIKNRDNITDEYLAKRESASIEYDETEFDYIINNSGSALEVYING